MITVTVCPECIEIIAGKQRTTCIRVVAVAVAGNVADFFAWAPYNPNRYGVKIRLFKIPAGKGAKQASAPMDGADVGQISISSSDASSPAEEVSSGNSSAPFRSSS